MNGYQLTDAWFEFRFQHPEKVSHAHTELYFYLIYHWNKLSQKEKFGLPSAITMEATGIRNYKTYSKCLNDLAEFGFIKIVQKAINQHQAVVVALGKNTKADTKALTEAVTKAQHEALPHIEELSNNRTIELKKNKFDLSGYGQMAYLVQRWLDYKKTINDKYKSQDSLDMFFKKLNKYSNNNPQLAEEIIETSMANQWKGIFEPKNKKNDQTVDIPGARSRRIHESYTP